ncbi:MAG TPA: EamA family transporter [Blastocatellia bacterium]|nr:EamA family transporter [Blastocatellia bacterium]
MKTLVILFIAICTQTCGDVFLTKGMRPIGEVNTLNVLELTRIGIQVFTSPYIWLGILLLSIFFGLYLVALSWADLSFVVPVTAFGYVLNAFMSWQLLGERVSIVRWIGTFIIFLGVAVVTRTEQRTAHLKEPVGAITQ